MIDATTLANLLSLYLRLPSGWDTSVQSATPIFSPPLTTGEQATYDRIVRIATSLVPGITPAEWQAIQSDIDGLVTYQGLASPTLAQTVLAVKAQSRILRAILKN